MQLSRVPASRALSSCIFGVMALIAGAAFFSEPGIARAASVPIQGYAWSDYLGWVHFNGSNYGVYQDSATGVLSGYAWSPYFGWISFKESELSGCPSGSCRAQVNLSTGAVTGWARSCAAFSNKSGCSGALDAGAGGWDGWIHLSGPNYGITSVNGCWSGFAWGAQNIGPIKFAGTATDGFAYKVGDPSCGVTPVPPVKEPAADACGSASGTSPQNPEPTGTSACSAGALYASSPADTALAWKWSCGAATCSAPKYGCTTPTDTNYNATGPDNVYGCKLTCKNGAPVSSYPTCTPPSCTSGGPPCCAPAS